MVKSDYRYALAMYSEDNTPLGQAAVQVDWTLAVEWARFQGIRRGELPPHAAGGSVTVEPSWQADVGPPCVACCRVCIRDAGGRTRCDVPTTYFSPLARLASRQLVGQGRLKEGERFRYVVCAVASAPQPAADGADGPVVEAISPPLALTDGRLADFVARSVPFGASDDEQAPQSGCGDEPPRGVRRRRTPRTYGPDVPAFIPQRVLEETSALTRQAGSLETGGVLIGHLRRDAGLPELFVEVTAQIPAEHTRRELTRLTFTADTWAAVRDAVALRQRSEIMLGWWHSHAYLHEVCAQCRKQKDGSCRASAAFMSADDCALHQTCFPRAYSLALVVADSPCSGLTWSLFGWQCGRVVGRGFSVMPGGPTPPTHRHHTLAAAGGKTNDAT